MELSLKIERFCYSEMGTFGKLFMPYGDALYTVELPWLNNIPFHSCIPSGIYYCSPRFYYRGGYQAVEVREVPNRTYITMHRGNTMNDSFGCICVGSKLGSIGGIWAVKNSANAWDRFMSVYGNKEFSLTLTLCSKIF